MASIFGRVEVKNIPTIDELIRWKKLLTKDTTIVEDSDYDPYFDRDCWGDY